MAKVLCTLPNASAEINGVKFEAHANGMLSEEVSDEVAAEFSAIPGYQAVGTKAQPDANKAPADADKAAARDALIQRAEAAGLKVKGTWSNERLQTEVEAAEKAADSESAAAAE